MPQENDVPDCPGCGAAPSSEPTHGDYTFYPCCTYRLTRTAAYRLATGKQAYPDPDAFKAMLAKRSSEHSEGPMVVDGDIERIAS